MSWGAFTRTLKLGLLVSFVVLALSACGGGGGQPQQQEEAAEQRERNPQPQQQEVRHVSFPTTVSLLRASTSPTISNLLSPSR